MKLLFIFFILTHSKNSDFNWSIMRVYFLQFNNDILNDQLLKK